MIVEGFTPHPDQKNKIKEIEKKDVKYIVLTCSRQWGKTILAQNLLLKWAIMNNNSTLMWVAPVYSQSRKVFQELVEILKPSALLREHNQTNLNMKLFNGSQILFRSAERPDTLRGYTLDYLIIDEAAFIKEDVWAQVLKPTVLVKGKKVLFISTPKGKNYLYNLAIRGEDEEEQQYIWLKGTAYDTPFINKDELEEARRSLPEDVFKQEMMGEFIDNGGEVFNNIDNYCTLTYFTPKIQGQKYYAGVDFGRQNDYTALTILDERGTVVYAWRERHKTWAEIMEHIQKKLKEYEALCQVEVNSIGDVLYEQLKKSYSNVEPFVTSSSSKQNIIEDLILATNNQDIQLPTYDLYAPLYNELKTFTYQYSLSSRTIKYKASDGAHDDTIMSLAIAYNTLKQRKRKGVYYVY